MIGKVCRVFKGENLESCLNMTPDQLSSLYHEARRQEAREILNFYHALSISKTDEDSRKKALEELEIEAFPFDPEVDGEFGSDEIKLLKGVIG